jgi:uncharacterized protein (DUF983 family)
MIEHNESVAPSRSLLSDLTRGFLGRCPACGKGRLFQAFLKVNDHCPACGEELHHHRADDFPPYLVMFIVGHVVVAAALHVEVSYAPPSWVHFGLWLPLTLGLCIGLLQPIKGAVVALQWHLGMHGFESAKKIRDSSTSPSLPLTNN